jgi:hypothetical protein
MWRVCSKFILTPLSLMKNFVILIIVLVGVWASLEIAYVYRLTSTERVKTRIAVKLGIGTNHLYLSLPRGGYICAFSNTPELKPSFTAGPSGNKEIQSDTTIQRDGRTLAKANTQWIKFHVNDNNYSVVEITTSVRQESKEPVYLIVGGTF